MLDNQVGLALVFVSLFMAAVLIAGIADWKKGFYPRCAVVIAIAVLSIIIYGVKHECAINVFCG